jgi:hypothetical protein
VSHRVLALPRFGLSTAEVQTPGSTLHGTSVTSNICYLSREIQNLSSTYFEIDNKLLTILLRKCNFVPVNLPHQPSP